MPESGRKRIRQPGQPHQTQGTDGSLWSVFIVVALIFGMTGVAYLRNVLGNPSAVSETLDIQSTAAASEASTPLPSADIPADGPGEAIELQGIAHIEQRQPHPEYNSDPPTSGEKTPE